jgi:hypothetical protein
MSDFVASAVEFIVGGILFTLAAGFLVITLASPGGWPSLSDAQMDFVSANSTILGIIFIAAAYATGVVGEGLARAVMEPLLDRHTVRNEAFLPKGLETEKTKEAEKADSDESKSRATAFRRWRTRKLLGQDYAIEHRNAARFQREAQRAVVMRHEQLHAEVQGQLKRLRLERVFAFSLGLTAVALLLRADWTLCAVTAFSCAITTRLVHVRSGRFDSSIARNHLLVAGTPPVYEPDEDTPIVHKVAESMKERS